MYVYTLSEKGKKALAKRSNYKAWVEHNVEFHYKDPKSMWCDKVVSTVTGEILDKDTQKSVDSYLTFLREE